MDREPPRMMRTSGRFMLKNGFSIAYQRWAAGRGGIPVLALHGWLDNSNSFINIAPVLASNGYDVVAIDHGGHGHSSHAPFGAILTPIHHIENAICVLNELNWTKTHLIGHSMGASTSAFIAGVFPERICKLVLIEGLGKISKPPESTAANLRKAITIRLKTIERTPKSSKVHDSFEAAVASRIEAVRSFPGKQYIHPDAAAAIVSRATISVDHPDRLGEEETRGIPGRVQFRHDPRLLHPNDTYFTPEQNIAVISDIESQTMLITAENGWPYNPKDFMDQESVLREKGLLTRCHYAEGSHHPHAFPPVATQLAHDIVNFLSSTTPPTTSSIGAIPDISNSELLFS